MGIECHQSKLKENFVYIESLIWAANSAYQHIFIIISFISISI